MKILISVSRVPLSIVRPYMAGWDKNKHNNLFMKYEHSKNKYRIYLPLAVSDDKHLIKIPTSVSSALADQGWVVEDYLAGIAVKSDNPKKKIRVGKLLTLLPSVKKVFDNDSQRAAYKNIKQWVVISRHPYDLLGMSFDRGWTSCMNLTAGEYKSHIKNDIKEGTLVAYLIKDLDKNINNPTARILIKPFTKGKHLLLSPETTKVYGSAPATFFQTVTKFCLEINKGLPIGKYTLKEGLYQDDSTGNKYNYDITTVSRLYKTPEALRDFLENTVDAAILTLVSKSESWGSIGWNNVRATVMRNLNTPLELLKLGANDKNSKVRRIVMRNPNTSKEVLKLGAKDKDETVRWIVMRNPNTSTEVLKLGAKDKDETVRVAVMENLNTPLEVLTLGANDKDSMIRATVMENPNTPLELLKLGAKDKDDMVRAAVMENPNTLVLPQSKS